MTVTYKYHEYIDGWIDAVENNTIQTCIQQKKLVELVKKQLSRKDVFVNSEKIYEAVDLMETYFYKLHDFQKFFIAFVVGVRDSEGFLLFDKYMFLGGRGIGKNGLISAIANYLLSNRNGIDGYNVDIVANNEEQAKTSFVDNYKAIKSNIKLSKGFRLTKEEIIFKKTNAKLKFWTSNANTKDGLRPGAIIFDEIHQYENYKILNVFTTALGKVQDPRRFYITTQGYIRDGVLDNLLEKAERILNEEEDHNGLFPFLFKMDSLEEIADKNTWAKANPRMMHDKHLARQIESEYTDALGDPDLMEEFVTKRMNIPYVQSAKTVADWDDILATNQEIPDLSGCECIGAVDFADLMDFCSVGMWFKYDNKRILIHHSFIHEKSIKLTKYNINIDEAVKAGYATIVSEKEYPVIPASLVVQWFKENASTYYIKKVVADRYRYSALKEEFEKEGIELEGIPSGTITHTKLHPQIKKLFAERNLIFGNDKLMRWYVWNTYVKTHKNGNKTYEKIEPVKRKTDGFFMMIHAMTKDDELQSITNITQDFGLITF